MSHGKRPPVERCGVQNKMRRKMQPAFFVFLLAIFLVVSVPPKAFSEETIRVAVPLFPLLGFPTFVAHERGFFQKEGLRAEIVRINSTPTTFQTLISGGVHLAVGAPGGLVTLNLQGIDVVALGSWDNVMPYILGDKKGTLPILARILRSEDKEALEYVYDYMRSNESPGLYPPEASIKNLLRMSTYDDPRAAALRAETIVDFSLLEELGQRSPQSATR